MHVVFDPDAIDWRAYVTASQKGGAAYFEGFPYQRGGAAYFEGFPYQRGAGLGSVFGSLFRYLLPILRTAGKEIGREGLAVGARVLGDIAQGKNFRQSVINETSEGLRSLADRTNPTEAIKTAVNDAQGRLLKGSGAKSPRKRKRAVSKPKKRSGVRSVKRQRLDYFGYV
jgi:hypothetical protein